MFLTFLSVFNNIIIAASQRRYFGDSINSRQVGMAVMKCFYFSGKSCKNSGVKGEEIFINCPC